MADATTDKIRLEIVTPKGLALAATVDEVTAPSVDGEFGVMPGHLPLLAALRTGLVTYKEGGDTKRCAVGSGFVEAGPHKLLILTDEYVTRDGVDPVIVRKELAEVEAEIEKLVAKTDAADAEQKNVLIQKENWLAAQLELYGDPPPPTMRPFEEYGPPAPIEEEGEEDAATTPRDATEKK
jgi:F-type H+-transporting ATPase subunit epsilon